MLTRVMSHGTTFMNLLKKKYLNLEQILYSKEPKLQSKLILKKIYMTKF